METHKEKYTHRKHTQKGTQTEKLRKKTDTCRETHTEKHTQR